ncbi:MAG: polysaccharide pyruvyl transferase family protein, partial [Clostridia bacterium]|nr:polysaccharide pyruvyl transferase family protein [Clostridia bacterium]
LLDSKSWEGFMMESAIKGPYLLYYALGEIPLLKQAALRLSKEAHLPIVNLKPLMRQLFSLRYKNLQDAGPLDFLTLFYNAAYVVTNSFHGTAFAIYFKKPFWIALSNMKGPKSTDSRILDLLELLGLRDRLLGDTLDGTDLRRSIPYEEVDCILEKERRKSLEFLCKALS